MYTHTPCQALIFSDTNIELYTTCINYWLAGTPLLYCPSLELVIHKFFTWKRQCAILLDQEYLRYTTYLRPQTANTYWSSDC